MLHYNIVWCSRIVLFQGTNRLNVKYTYYVHSISDRAYFGRADQVWQPQSNTLSAASSSEFYLLHNLMLLPAWLKANICQMEWMGWFCGWSYQDQHFKYDKRFEANWGHHIWHFWDIVSRTYWFMDKVVSSFLSASRCSLSAGKSIFREIIAEMKKFQHIWIFSFEAHYCKVHGLVINPVGLITLLLSCSSCHIASQIYRPALLQLFVTINDSNPFLIPNLHSWHRANHPLPPPTPQPPSLTLFLLSRSHDSRLCSGRACSEPDDLMRLWTFGYDGR